jgi:uncharacterized damage-inducible protein DinB
MKKIGLLAVCFAVALPAFPASKWQQEFLKHWSNTAAFTIEVADVMPEDGYASKPNPAEMSFGEVMMHIGDANARTFASISGGQAPAMPKASDKKTAIEWLKLSFAYCEERAKGMSDEQIEALSGPEGRKSTGRERMWAAFTHTAHHRGQAEVYLRVRNLVPPGYRF